MIDLAMCMTLQNEGFGTYGKTLFFGTSPVFDTGSVTNTEGIWVNASTVEIKGDLYTAQITISSRYFDVIKQGMLMLRLLHFINNRLSNYCRLTCKPIADIDLLSIRVHPAAGSEKDAIDGEGRWVESIRFNVDYKLDPSTLE